jgi:cyanophycin synthetase
MEPAATRGVLAVEAASDAALDAVRGIDPDRVVMVSRRAGNAALREHLEAGGKAATTAEDGGRRVIVLLDGDETVFSVPVDDVPALADGAPALKAHLFAVALAHGMGLSADEIMATLRDAQPNEPSTIEQERRGKTLPRPKAPTPIEILPASILSGFNIHHSSTVIRQEVDLGGFAELRSTAAGPDFAQRFIDRFNGLARLPTDPGLPKDFMERLRSAEGVPFVEVLFRAVMAVEGAMVSVMRHFNGIDHAEIVPCPNPARADFAWRCRVPDVSRDTARLALAGLRELLPDGLRWRADDKDGDFIHAFRAQRKSAWPKRFNDAQCILMEEVERKGIPWDRVIGPYIRLGQGKYQQVFRWTLPAICPAVANKLAIDKGTANRLLAASGFPVPRQAEADSVAAALNAAKEIGYPVVVKPSDQSGGKGISAGLKSPDEIPEAYERAQGVGSRIIIESFLEGDDHRLLVAGGQLIAACRRVPPAVTGDGKMTIGELIEELNADPRRDDFLLRPVALDEELDRLLGLAGYGLDTVMANGETFKLRSMANHSAGGAAIDITDQVHADNRDLAVRAARATGLPVAGVDFMTKDITRSYKEVGGGINEINSRPSIDVNVMVVEGDPPNVADPIIEMLFPPGEQGRVSTALLTGRESDPVAQTLDRILRSTRPGVALVTGGGATVGGEPAGREDGGPHEITRSVLRDRRVESLVRTVAPEHVARHGLLHEACATAAIMEPDDQEDEDIRRGIDVVVAATGGALVVEAASAAALASVRGIDPSRVVMVSRDAANAELLRHLEAGGKVATTARDRGRRMMVLLDGDKTVLSIPTDDAPALAEGAAGVKAYLFAIALAHGMDLSANEIMAALRDKRTQPQIHHPDQRSSTQRSAPRKNLSGKTKKRALKPATESP